MQVSIDTEINAKISRILGLKSSVFLSFMILMNFRWKRLGQAPWPLLNPPLYYILYIYCTIQSFDPLCSFLYPTCKYVNRLVMSNRSEIIIDYIVHVASLIIDWFIVLRPTQEFFTPPRHLIPPPVYPGVHVGPFISLICIFYLYFETDHTLVS
jgi:hypothetical protein